jgi:hypothetical protein
MKRTVYRFKDSKGKDFEYKSIHNRKVKFIVVASYPAHVATKFSSAVEAKRDIAGMVPDRHSADILANHHIRFFGAYDVELIEDFQKCVE